MNNIKNAVIGGVITLLVGGTAYTISQTDVAKNFANDTGLTQEQAEQYVNNVKEEDLASWDTVGSSFITDGQEILEIAKGIDCQNYEYEWESTSLTCIEGKMQMNKFANNSILLGKAFKKLDVDGATKDDMRETIILIDQMNSNFKFEIVTSLLSASEIDEMKKTNSYNKSLLKTIVETE
ncbi:MAG: hypothetical protein RLZZ517_68 [Candidatus Parcubacteria bacterium]|jgi:hypothetical protein